MGHLFAKFLRDTPDMGRLIFAIFWTACTLTPLLIGALPEIGLVERSIYLLFPAFGIFFTWHSWLLLRRWRSLRTETVGGVTFYIWIEKNGRECRATKDPRGDWEADDGDGDGDGGGGD